MITLYVDGFFVSPLDASCMIALVEKGVEFHTARALLRDGQGIPKSLGAKTLIPRVPAIQHGDFYLSESLAIIEYIEDAFPPPAYPRLFPAEPRARARARQVMSFIRCDLHALREEPQWWTCIYPTSTPPPPLSARATRDANDLLDIATKMIGELSELSIAQVDLAIQLMRLTRNGFDVPDEIRRFVDDVTARPSVRAYLEHARPPHPPARFAAYG